FDMHASVIRLLAASGLLLSLGLGLAPGSAVAETTDSAPTVLRIGVPTDLENANPFAVVTNSDWNVVTTQYDMMLKFGDEDLTAEPNLAESCEHNDSYKVWTCHIRDDVKWSDGEPLTSRDIAFTYELVMDKAIPLYRSYFTQNPTFETPDDQTLIWKSPEPTFYPETPPWVYIVPEHIWSQFEDADLKEIKEFENVPSVTSGPYYLSELNRGQNWTLTKNPYYWGDEPNYDQIEYQVFSNQDAMVQALQNGSIDVAAYLETSLLPALDGDENITVQRDVSDWWLNLAFNFGGQGPDADPLPALHDKVVRTAIAMAIDKQGIIDKAYNGAGVPGESVVRKASAWHFDVPDDEVLPFDPDEANAMLDDAGYKAGSDGVRIDPANGKPLTMRIPVSQGTSGAVIAGQLIVGYLDKIGIDAELLPVTDGKMYDYWEAGNFDAYIWYWTGDPDPNYQLSVFTSQECLKLSDGCWSNSDYDAMYEQQRTLMDQEERRQVVYDMQALVYEENPEIALAYPNNIEAYRNDLVGNFTPVPGADGYLIPNYNNVSMVTVAPASGAESDSSSSPGLPVWGWAA
ncbi:MAG: ABC transporter substrate-binding protein, partial [Candidatus Nanopelagicales bacterium]